MSRPAAIDFLVDIPLFKGLSLEEIQIVDEFMGLVEYNPGEVIFKEGEPGDFVCFVIDGTLSVAKQTLSGDQVGITKLSKGRAIGEMTLIDTLPRSATVTADTKVTVSVLRKNDYEAFKKAHPDIALKILTHITRNLSLSLRRATGHLADTIDGMEQQRQKQSKA